PSVRAALAPVDSLIARGWLAEAIAEARRIEVEVGGSILPALYRGSAWYLMASGNEGAPLDSALHAFREVLQLAPQFGPAHAGVAAVLARRRTRALAVHDSLAVAIDQQAIPLPSVFARVFPEVRQYERTARLIAAQLGPTA